MRQWPLGLVALAVGAVLWGGSKPAPQPGKREVVIIVTPLGDGMYSTRQLKIEKEKIDAAKAYIGL